MSDGDASKTGLPGSEPESGIEGLRIGTNWGNRFLLRRVLGRGACATVFAAEQVFLKRQIALKVPNGGPARSELALARLRREMQALALVRHPSVVRIFDGGEIDGTLFVALELLEGRTLSGLITSRSRLEPTEVAKLGAELAEALSAVHAAGIVHRDVKPSNVLVTPNLLHQACLLDFGTAKLVASDEPATAKLTHDGSIVGTPEYMPLQSLVDPRGGDARTDVYSLGVTLYECLTGGVPVEGPLGEILLKRSTAQVPSLRDVRPDVPGPLADAIHRSLKEQPEERYQTMAEFARDLSACIPVARTEIDVLRGQLSRGGVAPDARPTRADAVLARRSHVRAPYITPARIFDQHRVVADGRLEDISEGGALLVVEGSPTLGEVATLRFALPVSGRVVDAQGRFRWARSSRGGRAMGVEFIALPDASRAEIRQYVSLMGVPG